MLRLDTRIAKADVAASARPTATLSLPFHARSKSRQRVTLEDGRDAGIFLPRGSVLRGGDQLLGEGECVVVVAAPELVSRLDCAADDGARFGRACYHLGNRHVPLEISEGSAAYLADSVLDQMLHQMGLHVEHTLAPFEPEGGAYTRGHGHSHEHGDGHEHGHSHEHGDGHEHGHSHEQVGDQPSDGPSPVDPKHGG